MNVTIKCARCSFPKDRSAFAIFAKKRDRATGETLYIERDDTCRKCRSEMYRGVPDDIVKWRNKEAALQAQLKRVRRKIRSLLQVEAHRDSPHPEAAAP